MTGIKTCSFIIKAAIQVSEVFLLELMHFLFHASIDWVFFKNFASLIFVPSHDACSGPLFAHLLTSVAEGLTWRWHAEPLQLDLVRHRAQPGYQRLRLHTIWEGGGAPGWGFLQDDTRKGFWCLRGSEPESKGAFRRGNICVKFFNHVPFRGDCFQMSILMGRLEKLYLGKGMVCSWLRHPAASQARSRGPQFDSQ